MADHPFVDHVTGRPAVLVTGDGPPRVRHPGCAELADVTPALDAFYCPACRWSGRVSGAWVAHKAAGP